MGKGFAIVLFYLLSDLEAAECSGSSGDKYVLKNIYYINIGIKIKSLSITGSLL